MSKKTNESPRDRLLRVYNANAQTYSDMLTFKKGQREALTPTVYDARKKELETYLNNNKPLYNAANEAKKAENKYIEYSEKLKAAEALAQFQGISSKTIEALQSKQQTYLVALREKNTTFNALYKEQTKPRWNVTQEKSVSPSQPKAGTHSVEKEIKTLASSLASASSLLQRETRDQYNELIKLTSKSGKDIQDNLTTMQSAIAQTYATVSLSESKKNSLLKKFTDAAQKIVDKLTKKPPGEITTAVSKAKDAVEEAKAASQTSAKPSDNSPRGRG